MKKELLTTWALLCGMSGQMAFAQTDVTAQYLQNPGFEGTYEVQSNPSADRAIYQPEGWTVVLENMNENDMSILTTADLASNSFAAFTVNDEATRGNQTYWFRYRWGSNQTLKVSQEIANLPAGVYRLTADVLNYSADYNYTVMLYAGEHAQTRATISKEKADNWNTLTCDFYVENDGTIELGLSATNPAAAERIFAVDNFKLYKLDAEEPNAENPVSMTGYIVNPCFDANNVNGWICTTNAQNKAIAKNKSGDITGNFYENWNGSPFSGTIEQTVKGLPLGKYTLKLASFRELGDGGTGEIYAFANDGMTKITSDDGTYYEVNANVTDGTLTFGVKSVDGGCRWSGVDNVSLMYYGVDLTVFVEELKTLRETAANLVETEEVMSTPCRVALKDALAASESVAETKAELLAAVSAVATAISNANTSIANNAIFANGTVASDALANWTYTADNTFHVNTWSSEGNSDGSNMITPFLEVWRGAGTNLNDGSVFYMLEGMEPGMEYTATALVRVLNESGTATTGLTMFANENKQVIDGGEACDKGFYNTYSVSGVVGEDGVLKFGFEIADATFNWIAFKDIKIAAKVAETVYDLTATANPVDGSEVETLSVVLTFPIDYVEVSDKKFEVSCVNKETGEESFVGVEYPEGNIYNEWILNAVDMTTYEILSTPGVYELTVPAGVFGDKDWAAGNGGHANPEWKFTYTVISGAGDGIASVVAEGENADVYTINGVLVLKNADREALKTLKKGVYVINGKKVIMK